MSLEEMDKLWDEAKTSGERRMINNGESDNLMRLINIIIKTKDKL